MRNADASARQRLCDFDRKVAMLEEQIASTEALLMLAVGAEQGSAPR
jgi:hypothetical protein